MKEKYLLQSVWYLIEKHKTNWTKIKNLKNNELNDLPVYDKRCIKTKLQKKMAQNVNLFQSCLFILYLFMETNIICKYI